MSGCFPTGGGPDGDAGTAARLREYFTRHHCDMLTCDGVRDMFWAQPFNASLVDEHCRLAWGVAPRTRWVAQEYGGRQLGRYHSNIIFSSGGFDGWSSAGVATNLSSSLQAILLPDGGHHLDLMFSHPADPPSVRAARAFELEHIRRWVDQFASQQTPLAAWGDGL